MLREASVEGYAVDFRRSTRTYYTTGGEASFQFASYSLQGFDSALERHRSASKTCRRAGLFESLARVLPCQSCWKGATSPQQALPVSAKSAFLGRSDNVRRHHQAFAL